MGQYQQWLHYREIDQQLHAELEALEAQLADLQERAGRIEQTLPQANNQIISVLATMLKGQTTLANSTRVDEPIVEISLEEVEYWVENESADALPLQPALAAWGNLPNHETQDMPIQPAPPREKHPPGKVRLRKLLHLLFPIERSRYHQCPILSQDYFQRIWLPSSKNTVLPIHRSNFPGGYTISHPPEV